MAPSGERSAPAETRSRWGEAFDSASDFYRYFEVGLGEGRYKSAAFQLHQATERFYHCVLTAYRPKVHNLEDLGKRAGDLHPALRNVFPRGTPEDDRLFKLLKHAYVDARYDPKFTITRQELESIAVHVRELRTRVEKVCRERIEAMESPPS